MSSPGAPKPVAGTAAAPAAAQARSLAPTLKAGPVAVPAIGLGAATPVPAPAPVRRPPGSALLTANSPAFPIAKLHKPHIEATAIETEVATELNALVNDKGKLTIKVRKEVYSLTKNTQRIVERINFALRDTGSPMRIAIGRNPDGSIIITYGEVKTETVDPSTRVTNITFDKKFSRSHNIGTLADRIEVQMEREATFYDEAHKRVDPICKALKCESENFIKKDMTDQDLKKITHQLPNCTPKERAKIRDDLKEIVSSQTYPPYQFPAVVGSLYKYQCSGFKKGYYISYSETESFRDIQQKRAAILKEFGVEKDSKHPFLETLKNYVPIRDIDTLKSASVYWQTAEFKKAGLFKARTLLAVDAGAGSKLSPLLLATLAMDEDLIDSAKFIYTEIRSIYIPRLHAQLEILKEKGVIRKYSHTIKEFPAEQGGGVEVEFTFQYINKKGQPKDITLTYALNRSGNDYFREDQVNKADLVIWDDMRLDSEYNNKEFILKNRRSSGQQLVIIEKGNLVTTSKEEKDLKKKYHFQNIDGQYGCCPKHQNISSQSEEEQWPDGAEVEYGNCREHHALLFKLPPTHH